MVATVDMVGLVESVELVELVVQSISLLVTQ